LTSHTSPMRCTGSHDPTNTHQTHCYTCQQRNTVLQECPWHALSFMHLAPQVTPRPNRCGLHSILTKVSALCRTESVPTESVLSTNCQSAASASKCQFWHEVTLPWGKTKCGLRIKCQSSLVSHTTHHWKAPVLARD
jgi:hypothetical protein